MPFEDKGSAKEIWSFLFLAFLGRLNLLSGKVVFMRKKNYKGVKCTKRYVEKCEDICKIYDAIQYAYAECEALFEEHYN